MFTVFEQVNNGKYKRPLNNSSKILKNIQEYITFSENGFPVPKGIVIESSKKIIIDNVPIITPNFDVVVPKLSLVVS